MNTKKTIERLSKSKQHRAAYVSSQINIGLPFQIRALRKQREWDQAKLAIEAEMVQPRISAMENAGHASFNLATLKRLAEAFDVALIVRFAPYSELIRWSDKFSPDDFRILSFSEELKQAESNDNVLPFNYLQVVRDVVPTGGVPNSATGQYAIKEKNTMPSIITENLEGITPIQWAA